jgi:shikimate kinase / 3-dehydroquinate synthase
MRRPLIVVGPPASLKSKIAQVLSERSGRRLAKADTTTLVEQWSAQDAPVIEVSSEVWLDRALRLEAIDRCVVVAVVCAGGCDSQPLGHSSLETKLWRAAAGAFDEAHCVVSVEEGTVEEVAREILQVWERDPIAVVAGERSYRVEVGHGVVDSRLSELLVGSATNLVVTDSNVERLYGARFDEALRASGSRSVKVVFEAGEQQKHLQTLTKVYEAAQLGGIDRSSKVVAIGGGVVTDVAGFAAATWMRGLSWFGISTTLLGMVDASVGGKTAVDFSEGKNAVGAFWQPSGVVCDTELLVTESERNFRGALAEVVKTAVIGDRELFELLESEGPTIGRRDPVLLAEVVRRCVRVKARIVGEDATEKGVRATLNLGHTVGHALEAVGGYGRLSHGEAVSLGLVSALRTGVRLGFTPSAIAERIVRLQVALGLPVALDSRDLRAASELLGYDKKKTGKSIRFIVVEDIGCVTHRMLMAEDLRVMLPALAG